MRYRFVMMIVSLLVLSFLFGGVAVAQQQDTSQRINTITIDENGDATWDIEIREELTTEQEINSFEEYISQVENESNTQVTEQFRSDLSNVVQSANGSFERDMQFQSLSVDARVADTATGTFGVTTVSFTWTNYAEITDGDINVGEILSDGYTISEGERLRIVMPENYSSNSDVAGGEINGNAVEWNGPYAFSDTSLTFSPSDESSDPIPTYVYVLVFSILSLTAAGFIVYKSMNEEDSEDEEQNSEEPTSSQNDLKTDEEKLISLIKDNDGRIKQKTVSEKFDWSDAKVSRVTKKLEDEDLIQKLTIGRENVLDLKDKS